MNIPLSDRIAELSREIVATRKHNDGLARIVAALCDHEVGWREPPQTSYAASDSDL